MHSQTATHRSLLGAARSLAALAGRSAQTALQVHRRGNGKIGLYGQTPGGVPPARPNEQLNRQGTVREAQRSRRRRRSSCAAREAERKRKLDEDMAAKEEKRKNQALLNTYASEKDIDEARERALQDNEEAIKEAEQQASPTPQKRQKRARRRRPSSSRRSRCRAQLKLRTSRTTRSRSRRTAELLDAKKKEIEQHQREVRRGQAPLPRADARADRLVDRGSRQPTRRRSRRGWRPSRRAPHRRLAAAYPASLLFRDLVHLRRIGLALGRLHRPGRRAS